MPKTKNVPHYEDMHSIQSELKKSRSSIDTLIQKNSKLKERIAILEHEIANGKRLRNQIKGVVRAFDNVIEVEIRNIAKKKYKHKKLSFENNSDPKTLLEFAHSVDTSTYIDGRKNEKRSLALYTVANTTHKFTKKNAKRAFRMLKKVVKR